VTSETSPFGLWCAYATASGSDFTPDAFSLNANYQRAALSLACYVAGGATLWRTVIITSSNSGSKLNFSSNPNVAITPIADLDFGNSPPVTITRSTYTVDSSSISGTPGVDTDHLISNGTGTITLTLPTPTGSGRKINIKTIAAHTVQAMWCRWLAVRLGPPFLRRQPEISAQFRMIRRLKIGDYVGDCELIAT
jgi:hypothetical protein